MLMLVHPAPAGNSTDPPKRRRRAQAAALSLTDAEARALFAAVRNVARTFGSLRKLATALGVRPDTLTAKCRPDPGLAIALARLSGMSVDAVLGRTGLAVVSTAPSAEKGGAS